MLWNRSHDFHSLKSIGILYIATSFITDYHLKLSFIYCRTINNVRGFTRETTTALLTTIESTEWMRKQATNGLVPVEHPRASTTDDVECFFSMMRDLLGSSFRLTTVMQEWRKICTCVEFDKRVDPQLPFHYYTSDHDRYYVGEHPSFNKPTNQPCKSIGDT